MSCIFGEAQKCPVGLSDLPGWKVLFLPDTIHSQVNSVDKTLSDRQNEKEKVIGEL
jgi:hypothetical protein